MSKHNIEHEGISLSWQGASSNEFVGTNRWLMIENLLLCFHILHSGHEHMTAWVGITVALGKSLSSTPVFLSVERQ